MHIYRSSVSANDKYDDGSLSVLADQDERLTTDRFTKEGLPYLLMKMIEIVSYISSLDEIICHDHNYSYFVNIYKFYPAKYKLLQKLNSIYEYSTKFEVMDELHNDNFFQIYVSKYGNNLDENFMLVINNYKNIFADKISNVLHELDNVISLMSDITKETIYTVCYSFSKDICDSMGKCTDILQSDIIPMVIKVILNCRIVNESYKKEITYAEMEQLFLNFISALERLIMSGVVNYWNHFFNKNKLLLSLNFVADNISNFPYKFCRPHITENSSNINCSDAFTCKFGVYISFMTVAKLEIISDNFVKKCATSLKNLVRSTCIYICNYSNNSYDDILNLRKGLIKLIKKEFDKMISKEKLEDNLSNFLKESVIYNQKNFAIEFMEINRSSVISVIISDIYKSLISSVNKDLLMIIARTKNIIISSKERALKGGSSPRTIESKWGVKLHPEDSYNILVVRRKFSAKSRIIIRNKFSSMMKEGYKFSDGTVIGVGSWNDVSKNLFPIAQGEVRHLLYNERLCIFKILSNARIMKDVGALGRCSIGTREATSEEKESILRIAVKNSYIQTKDMIRSVWVSLIKIPDINKYDKNIVSDMNSCLLSSVSEFSNSVDHVVDKGNLMVTPPLLQGKIIDRWGINIYPDDDKLILFMRKRFSTEIRGHFRRLFSSMLEKETVLPSGSVLRKCCWYLVFTELHSIAIKSVKPIIENEYLELDRVLSKTRIMDVDRNKGSSCTLRVVTNDEKSDLMERARIFIDKRLIVSTKLSLMDVINTPMSGYEEKYECVNKRHILNDWGVAVRYEDNCSILNIRRKFSSKIRSVAYHRFHKIIKDKYRFEDGYTIAKLDWIMVSDKVFPIILDEIKYIIERESIEAEGVVSKARIIVDHGIDRETTNEEKSVLLKNIMKFMDKKLECLLAKVWRNVIASLENNDGGNRDFTETKSCDVVNCNREVSVASPNVSDIVKLDSNSAECKFSAKLRGENIREILKVKKKFSSEMNKCVSDKFCKLIEYKCTLDDGTVIDKYPWKIISKKMIPIAKKEIEPIIEMERVKIREILLRSLIIIHGMDGHTRTRELTSDEVLSTLEEIMSSVYKNAVYKFSIIWGVVVKMPEKDNLEEGGDTTSEKIYHGKGYSSLLESLDISDADKVELDNIRLEFVGNLGSIIGEVVNELLLDVDNGTSLSDDISMIVSNRSCILFNEGGFGSRVESLLSSAKIVGSSGEIRLVSEEEKKYLFNKFMDSIHSDRDHLVRKRTEELALSSHVV